MLIETPAVVAVDDVTPGLQADFLLGEVQTMEVTAVPAGADCCSQEVAAVLADADCCSREVAVDLVEAGCCKTERMENIVDDYVVASRHQCFFYLNHIRITLH